MKKIRPLIKCHGGKYYLCDKIIPLLPPHVCYVEPFGGGANVLINKPPSPTEILNDINHDLINLYIRLQLNHSAIIKEVSKYDYSRKTFEDAQLRLKNPDPTDRAIAYLIRNRMSRGGLEKTFASSNRLRGGIMGDANAWRTFIQKDLPKLCNRLLYVSFTCMDGITAMKRWDESSTVHYCDPPYLPETRTAKKVYTNEMTLEDHMRFLKTALRMKGCVVISGYHNPLYDEALAKWGLHECNMPNHSGQNQKKQRRIECVWVSK